jgi:alkaline phosphatase/fibronectin type 3 domain-containing protein
MNISLLSYLKCTAPAALSSVFLSVALSTSAQTPKNVILFIGDGMGFEHVKAARLYQGAPLSFENFPNNAQVRTYSANNAVTDSAAGASAMATGSKVNNGVISVALPGNGGELETTLEFFKKEGKTTGLITTAYLTHATPAGFGAHDSDRNNTTAIGTDLTTQTQPNVLFGGGGNGLSSATSIAAGYQVAIDTTSFNSLDTTGPKLCGLFGSGYMPYEEDYLPFGYPYPHLREMVAKALNALERNENGFFLMVEAGRIDHAAGSTTLPEMVHETLELSRAVQVAVDWVANRADTLIIVTADHETGGLTVTKDNGAGNYPTVTWASPYAHTSANVPAYAYGLDAVRVSGTLDNTYIHPICTGEALSVPAATFTLIPTGATWKYEASGTDLGTAWRAPGYDDSAWLSGPAQLGYGDGDEATILPSSPIRSCYYFRHTFSVANPAEWNSLSLQILRDDGAVVYLNGQEVARYNIDDDPVLFSSWAQLAADYPWDPAKTIPNLLVAGDNVLAVEVHQCNSTSSDISLDLKLTGSAELTVIPNAPIAGATGVPTPATLTATATDPAGKPLTVAFYGRQAPPPAPDFSIVVLPDTQNYTAGLNGGTPAMFVDQTQWIVDNRASRNIVYAAHVGDVSNNGDIDEFQWVNAQSALSLLDQAAIPYGLAVGNHDLYVPSGDNDPSTLYNQYFGVSHFLGRSYYGGHYGEKNNNHYDMFSASGLDFIVIYLEYATNTAPSAAVLDWAGGLLKANPNRRGIVVSHQLLETSGTWSPQGQGIYNALRDNPNLFLMLCGHYSAEVRRTDVYGGNTVHTLMADYQGEAYGGNGFLRILRFSPSNNQVFVQTYSPLVGQYQTDSASEFVLSYPMQTGPAFQLIQQNTAVASGTPTSATWTGLLPGAEYEWFAMATEGPERAIGETRRFTTLDNVPPTIAITSPENGATFGSAPAEVTITASASDSDGSLTSVQFFANGVGLGVDSVAPYQVTASLDAGTYALTAVATDNQGTTTTSAPVHVTVGAPPTAPSALAATVDSRTQITLTWTDTSYNESGFEVYQSTSGSAYALIGTTGANANSAIITGLQPSTTYSFIVRAFNGSGFADSVVATATTTANFPPVAAADLHTVSEDSALTIVAAAGVLANDTDGDSDLLTAALVSGPSHGALNLGPDGSFAYIPNANFSGQDSFSYEARDAYSAAPATVTINVTPVNDPPTVPPSVAANASAGLVTLSWAASTDPDGDLVSYQVYRSEASPVSNQKPLATVSALGYSDSAVVNGTTYYYVIVAVDPSGVQSTATGEVSATPDVLPVDVFVSGNPVLSSGTLAGDYAATFDADGVTQNITETGTSTGARLQADYTLVTSVNPADITSLSLFLKASWSNWDGATDPLLVQIQNSSGSWESITEDIRDGQFSPNVPQNYVAADGTIIVRFTDGAMIRREKKDTLRIDQLFAQIVAGRPDTTAPSTPSDLAAAAGDTQIQLHWTGNVETDVVGYNIYRSTSPGSGYVQVNSALVPTSPYVDSGLNNGTKYYYVLTAVDGSGNESDPTGPVEATPVDQAPAAPSGLTAVAGDGQVTLDWADNAEPDVVGYKVYRSTGGGAYSLVAVQPVTTSQYLDSDLVNGTAYTYYVTAVDGTRESTGSSTVMATPMAQVTMHVETLTVVLTQSGKSYKASGTAYLVNSGNLPLASATLTGQWWLNSGNSGSLLQTQTVTSDSNGAALFTSAPVKVTSGTTFTLRITGVALAGYVFVPTDGVAEAISPSVP